MSEGIYTRGALRSRLAARLAGASPHQLSRWHRSGLIVATILPGGRRLRRLYSWVEYAKVRVAVKLIKQHLPRHRLRPNLFRLGQEVPEWYRLSLLAHQKHVIVPTEDGMGYTILDTQLAQAQFIASAEPRRMTRTDDDFEQVISSQETLRALPVG